MRFIIEKYKKTDKFSRNIILVLAGNSLMNFFNFLYQLILAHGFSPVNFAAFNALLSLFVIITAPFLTLQTAVIKYTAEFSARGETAKVKRLLSKLLHWALLAAFAAAVLFLLLTPAILRSLQITSRYGTLTFVLLIASACVIPVLSGGIQGLELFKWFVAIALASTALKLILAPLIPMLGLGIAAALGGFLACNILVIVLSSAALKAYLAWPAPESQVNFKEIFSYLVPVALNSLCFMALVNLDMIMVKRYFSPEEAGIYSFAQMVGKAFLFLPSAILIVMFPHTSGQSVQKIDTSPILKKSVFYAAAICLSAAVAFNLFPAFALRVITGREFAQSIALGRMFSLSMSFFALLSLVTGYFLSLKDLRFLKYLGLFTLLEALLIILFHRSLFQVQLILCATAAALFLLNLGLAYKKIR
jgi:O-antigen/teichoic acid export membrane protein